VEGKGGDGEREGGGESERGKEGVEECRGRMPWMGGECGAIHRKSSSSLQVSSRPESLC